MSYETVPSERESHAHGCAHVRAVGRSDPPGPCEERDERHPHRRARACLRRARRWTRGALRSSSAAAARRSAPAPTSPSCARPPTTPGRRTTPTPHALAEMLWTIYSCPVPVIAPHPRRLLCRRARPRLGVRHPRRRRSRDLLAQRSTPRPAAGDDQPVRHPRHGRAGGAALFRHCRALRRGRGAGDADSRTRSCATTAIDQVVGRFTTRSSPTGRWRRAPASNSCRDVAGREISAELRADTARRIADIRASAEGTRRDPELSRQACSPAWLLPATRPDN